MTSLFTFGWLSTNFYNPTVTTFDFTFDCIVEQNGWHWDGEMMTQKQSEEVQFQEEEAWKIVHCVVTDSPKTTQNQSQGASCSFLFWWMGKKFCVLTIDRENPIRFITLKWAQSTTRPRSELAMKKSCFLFHWHVWDINCRSLFCPTSNFETLKKVLELLYFRFLQQEVYSCLYTLLFKPIFHRFSYCTNFQSVNFYFITGLQWCTCLEFLGIQLT